MRGRCELTHLNNARLVHGDPRIFFLASVSGFGILAAFRCQHEIWQVCKSEQSKFGSPLRSVEPTPKHLWDFI